MTRPLTGGMIARAYKVVDMAVEHGVEYGWKRAHKHVENPTPEEIREAIKDAVVNELCEWFILDDEHAT